MLSFEATHFFIMMEHDAQHVATHHNLMGKKKLDLHNLSLKGQTIVAVKGWTTTTRIFFILLDFLFVCFTQIAGYLTPFLFPV